MCREIEQLHTHTDWDQLPAFTNAQQKTDSPNEFEVIPELYELLENMKQHIFTTVPQQNVRKYSVPWANNGVQLSNGGEHAEYVRKICADVRSLVLQLVDTATAYSHSPSKLIQEVRLMANLLCTHVPVR